MADGTKNCTPSEMLIEALEKFGEDEPHEAVLVYLNESGEIVWKSTTPHRTRTIGMLALVQNLICYDITSQK